MMAMMMMERERIDMEKYYQKGNTVLFRGPPLEYWGGAGVFLEIYIFVGKMGEINNDHKVWWKYSLSWGETNKAFHLPCEINKNGQAKKPSPPPFKTQFLPGCTWQEGSSDQGMNTCLGHWIRIISWRTSGTH